MVRLRHDSAYGRVRHDLDSLPAAGPHERGGRSVFARPWCSVFRAALSHLPSELVREREPHCREPGRRATLRYDGHGRRRDAGSRDDMRLREHFIATWICRTTGSGGNSPSSSVNDNSTVHISRSREQTSRRERPPPEWMSASRAWRRRTPSRSQSVTRRSRFHRSVYPLWGTTERGPCSSSDGFNSTQLADVNGDGLVDFVQPGASGVIHWWPGHGDGNFGACTAAGVGLECAGCSGTVIVSNPPAATDLTNALFHDVTGDGFPDMIVPRSYGFDLSVGQGLRQFGGPQRHPLVAT